MKRLICLLLVLALVLVGCVDVPTVTREETEPDETQPAGEEALAAEETATDFGLAYIAEYGFNPYKCTCITNRPVLSLVYESLFVLNNTFQPEPVLCDRFAVSENGQTYILTLREGIVFSDGSEMTSQDVVTSLRAAAGSEYYGSRFAKVADFYTSDSRTVIIALNTPYENLPLLLDVPIVKASTVDDQEPVGSGPYYLSAGGSKRFLQRSRRWWQDAQPPVDETRILLEPALSPSEVRDSFEFGATSLVCADLNSPTAVGYRCDYELWDCPTTVMQYLGFNLGAGLFANQEFRSAVTHIINREAIIASVYKGFAEPAYLPCAPASPLYDADLAASYGYDKNLFLQAKRAAGITEGDTGTILVYAADSSRVEAAHQIADTLAEVGVKLEVKAQDYDTYRYNLSHGVYDMYIGEARLSGNFDLTEFFQAYGSLCYGGLQSGNMTKLCADALENSGNCYSLHKSVMDTGYFCPLLFKSYAVMANRGVITALQPAVDNVFHLSGGRTLADASVSYDEMTGNITPDNTPLETDEAGNPILPTQTDEAGNPIQTEPIEDQP